MTDVNRMRIAWNDSKVTGGGVSTLYFVGDGAGVPAAVKTFFTSCASKLPIGVQITVPSSGDVLDVATGQPKGLWSAAGGGQVNGAGNSEYAGGVGTRIQWQTLGWNNGRRVRGSLFLVPLPSDVWDLNGNLKSAVRIQFDGAAAALVSAITPSLVVWSRGSSPGMGTLAAVTAGTCSGTASWLRSRRT